MLTPKLIPAKPRFLPAMCLAILFSSIMVWLFSNSEVFVVSAVLGASAVSVVLAVSRLSKSIGVPLSDPLRKRMSNGICASSGTSYPNSCVSWLLTCCPPPCPNSSIFAPAVSIR